MSTAESRTPAGHTTPVTVAGNVDICLSSFDKLLELLRIPDCGFQDHIQASEVLDELNRFNSWLADTRARARGHNALEYRLRDDSKVRLNAISTIQLIVSMLQELRAIVSGEKELKFYPAYSDYLNEPDNEDANIDEDEDEDEDAEEDEIESSDGADEPKIDLVFLGDEEESEIQRNMHYLRGSISILNRAAPRINDPSRWNFPIIEKGEKAFYESGSDIELVRSKFPRAEEYLVLRLGWSIYERRRYLLAREKKQPRGISINNSANPSFLLFETVKEGNYIDLDDEDEHLDPNLTPPIDTGDTPKLGLPIPKEGKGGRPFECPLCFMVVTVRNECSWNKHVLRDLLPYVCTFECCSTRNHLYEKRHLWFSHERENHPLTWICTICQLPLSSKSTTIAHLEKEHLLETPSLSNVLPYCAKEHSERCPLCRQSISSLTELEKHLGDHQEELALLAVPSSLQQERVEKGTLRAKSNNANEANTSNVDEMSSVTADSSRMGVDTSSGQAVTVKDLLDLLERNLREAVPNSAIALQLVTPDDNLETSDETPLWKVKENEDVIKAILDHVHWLSRVSPELLLNVILQGQEKLRDVLFDELSDPDFANGTPLKVAINRNNPDIVRMPPEAIRGEQRMKTTHEGYKGTKGDSTAHTKELERASCAASCPNDVAGTFRDQCANSNLWSEELPGEAARQRFEHVMTVVRPREESLEALLAPSKYDPHGIGSDSKSEADCVIGIQHDQGSPILESAWRSDDEQPSADQPATVG